MHNAFGVHGINVVRILIMGVDPGGMGGYIPPLPIFEVGDDLCYHPPPPIFQGLMSYLFIPTIYLKIPTIKVMKEIAGLECRNANIFLARIQS